MKKTALEHFKDIKELETADAPKITVEDLLPYKCEQVEQALTELKAIKEAKPSKALECLKKNRELFDKIAKENSTTYKDRTFAEAFLFKTNTIEIEQSLLKAQEMEKALKIIKEKNVDVYALTLYDTVEEYNLDLRTNPTYYCYSNCEELTKEEFNLLKELTGND